MSYWKWIVPMHEIFKKLHQNEIKYKKNGTMIKFETNNLKQIFKLDETENEFNEKSFIFENKLKQKIIMKKCMITVRPNGISIKTILDKVNQKNKSIVF